MSKLRVLVGTKKGAFILTGDGKRKQWDVSGPHFAGWEMYHLKGSPVEPNRIYASQTSGWFGQIIQRSDDGGKTWSPPGTKFEDLMGPDGMPKGESPDPSGFLYEGEVGTHKWYDGTQHPWEFKRVWHLEPSLSDADTVYAGVEDAAIFKTVDGGTISGRDVVDTFWEGIVKWATIEQPPLAAAQQKQLLLQRIAAHPDHARITREFLALEDR